MKSEPVSVVRKVLPNGLTLLVQEDHAHPLAAFHAVVRSGSATEGRFLGAGVSHVVEHMLFKGTARRPVGAVEREAQSYGGTAQGFTTYDVTSYQIVVNKEHWSAAADLMVDALFFPTMDEGELAKERQVVLRELKLRDDDPDRVLWDLLFQNAYRRHPYGIPIIGYEPVMTALTREDVLEYHRQWYRPNAVVFSVVGNVKAEEVVRRFEELTAGIPPGRIPYPALPEEPPPLFPRRLTQEADVTMGISAIGFPSVAVSDPDLFAVDLLSWVLGGGRGSRLDRRLKESGIVHSVTCWSYTPRDPGLLVVSMRMDTEKIPQATEAAFSELELWRRELLPEDEVEAAKRMLLRGYLESRQTVAGQASDIGMNEMLLGDPQFSSRYVEGIQRLTPEDLRRVAEKYIRRDRSTTVVLQPRGTLASAAEPTSAGMETESTGRVAPAPRHFWSDDDRDRRGMPIGGALGLGSEEGAEAVVEKVILKNGLKVILKPERRLPLIAMQVSLLGGVRYETEESNGVSALVSRMLLRGTSGRNADAIARVIRQMGADLHPFHGRNSLGLTFEALRSEGVTGLRLLGDLLLHPTFPDDELEKERRLALAGIKASEEDTFSWGVRRLNATLFTQHPYRFDPLGSAGAVQCLTRQDLLGFYKKVLNPRAMVLCIVGDFDRSEILRAVEETFGRIRVVPESPPAVPQEPPLQSPRERLEATPREEGLILIGFPGLRVDDPSAPALDLLEGILSGGAGRLFTEIRERRGLAYTVGSFAMHGVDPGSFVLYAVTDPSKIPTVQKALLEEARRIGTAPLPQEELGRVRAGLLGRRRMERQVYSSQAAQMSLDELYGLGYDYAQRYDEKIQQVKPEEIQALARDLLGAQRYAVVIGHPREKESRAEGVPATEAEGAPAARLGAP